jgi:hypothetical protein
VQPHIQNGGLDLSYLIEGRASLCRSIAHAGATWFAVALAMGALGACGGSAEDEEAPKERDANPWAQSASWPKPDFYDPHGASEEIQIREVITDVQRDFPARIGSGVCHELTPAGRREIVDTGISAYDTCKLIVPEIVRRMRAQGVAPRFPKVLKVTIDGARATALLREPGGEPYRIPLVKLPGIDNGWKLPSLALLQPVGNEQLAKLKPNGGDPRVRRDREAITEVITDAQGDFAAGFGANVCAKLLPAERDRLARAGDAQGEDCGAAVDRIRTGLRRAAVEPWSAELTSIEINGARAVARVRNPAEHRDVRFYKEREQSWRIVSLDDIEPVAAALGRR